MNYVIKNRKITTKVNSAKIFFIFIFSLFFTKDSKSFIQLSGQSLEKSKYVIEYKGREGVTVKSYSNEKSELNRVFKDGDKVRWYLTQDEFMSINYSIEDYEKKKWFELLKTKTGNNWITLSLKPTFRYDKINFSSSIEPMSFTISSNDTKFLEYDGLDLPSYPPGIKWASTQKLTSGQQVLTLANKVENNSFDLKMELPWGFESELGEKSWIMNISTESNKVNQISLAVSRLPIIPLIYINYSEQLQSHSIRRIHQSLKEFDGKLFISLGHDGQISYYDEIFSSKPENWDRLNHYLNRNPTIGYASIPRTEINHFVKRINDIEFNFWDNHIALPILIFPFKNFQKQNSYEISHWIKSMETLANNKLIKQEFVIILIDDFNTLESEMYMQIDDYSILKLTWRSDEINRKFVQLLKNLEKGLHL